MMFKISKILILILIIAGMFSFGLPKIFQSSAQEEKIPPVEKKLPKIVDKDKNKIFDNLEELLMGQPDEVKFDAILLFEENLSDNLFENIKGKIGDFSIKYQYPSISGIAATLTKGQITALSKIPFLKQIEYDAEVIPFLDKANYWFGTQKARTDFGLDGNMDGSSTYSKNDIVIAVIDTGIDPNHVDLDGGKIIGWKDFATGQTSPYDEVVGCGGHGTHVSSIAAGEGQGNSLYKGVATGAALVGVKVLKKRGQDCVGTTADVNAGVQWVIDNKATYGIEIFNMSLGIAGCSDGTDSTSLIVNNAVDAGLIGVVAAGNEGPKKCTIGSPAAAAKAITIGAMADIEPGAATAGLPAKGFYQAYFSSRGPTADNRVKPDISAPGVKITAAKAGTTNGYIEYNGTSMSSPFVAGLAGLMLQASSTLTPLEIKNKIALTAINWDGAGADIDYGAGRLDGYEAIKSAGGYSGTNITTPAHQYFTGNLTGTGDVDWYDINVTNASYPIAVTLIMPNWISSTNPDFDIALYLSDGTTKLTESISATRQETVGYQPTTAGIYKLKIYSYTGSGNYFFDQSAGTGPVISISIVKNSTFDYGVLPLSPSVSNPTEKNTIQLSKTPVVQNTGGIAVDLTVKSSDAIDGTVWNLVAAGSIGTNNYSHQYSTTTGVLWTDFPANNGYTGIILSNLGVNATSSLDLQILMPTDSTDSGQKNITVTIRATQSP